MSARQEHSSNPQAVRSNARAIEFAEVLKKEIEEFANRPREPAGQGERLDILEIALKQKLIGLAFSGGGIRSATFNLGVLQGLADCVPNPKKNKQTNHTSGEIEGRLPQSAAADTESKQTHGTSGECGEGLLGKIDYLSTVSGGGYIGSWFVSWVLRDGDLKNVEKQLRANRFDQAEAIRPNAKNEDCRGTRFDSEPNPISHLREYSNYLAPRVGMFSPDAWTLYAIYLRNLLAIQAILLPLIMAVVFAVLYIAWCFVNFTAAYDAWKWLAVGVVPLEISVGLAAARLAGIRLETTCGKVPQPIKRWAIVILVLQIVILGLAYAHAVRDEVPWYLQIPLALLVLVFAGFRFVSPQLAKPSSAGEFLRKVVFYTSFLFIVSASTVVGFLASIIHSPISNQGGDVISWLEKVASKCRLLSTIQLLDPGHWGWDPSSASVALTICMTICARLVLNVNSICSVIPHMVRREFHGVVDDLRWILSGIVSGATAGGLLILFERLFIRGQQHPCLMATVGAPMIITVFATGEAMALAILSALEPPRVREWFAALGGKVLMAAVTWLTLFSLILFVPSLLEDALDTYHEKVLAVVSWMIMSIGTARAAYSSKADGKLLTTADIVIKAGPVIFLIGLFVFTAWVTEHVLVQAVLPDSPKKQIVLDTKKQTVLETNEQIVLNAKKQIILDSNEQIVRNTNKQIVLDTLLTKNHIGLWKPELAGCAGFSVVMLVVALCASLARKHGTKLNQGQNRVSAADSRLEEIQNYCLLLTLAGLGLCVMRGFDRGLPVLLALAIASLLIALVLGRFINVNLFSLQELYQNRLVRCYLGASRENAFQRSDRRRDNPPFRVDWEPKERNFEPLTGFDEHDDFHLSDLQYGPPPSDAKRKPYTGPMPIVCAALNEVRAGDLAWQERMAESFVFTPYRAGALSTKYRPTKADPDGCSYGGNVTLGQVVALSGAAVSPNMGYYSTAPVTALLTIFNLRLGAWLGNPKSPKKWIRSGPKLGWYHLLKEALGFTNAASEYVYISDGGHFDNLGVYELIRRRCRVIICCDAGADPTFSMHELGMLIRKVRIDFGIRIEIRTDDLKPDAAGFSRSHVAVGRIAYSDRHGNQRVADEDRDGDPFVQDLDGYLIYIKPSFTGDEPADVIDYRTTHPVFPHQSTLEQFFSESQFESYRTLGSHIIKSVFGESVRESDSKMFNIVTDVYNRFEPTLTATYVEQYVDSNGDFINIQTSLRTDLRLDRLARELATLGQVPRLGKKHFKSASIAEPVAERQILIEMLSVLENVYFALGLDRTRLTSTNKGWLHVVDAWLCTSPFRVEWTSIEPDFSPEFRRFVNSRRRVLERQTT